MYKLLLDKEILNEDRGDMSMLKNQPDINRIIPPKTFAEVFGEMLEQS